MLLGTDWDLMVAVKTYLRTAKESMRMKWALRCLILFKKYQHTWRMDVDAWYDMTETWDEKERAKNTISIKDCKDGGVYFVDARNFSYGIYNKKDKSFYGIRTKFRDTFIDSEEHWDCGEPHGTARPYILLEEIEPKLITDDECRMNILKKYDDALL